MITDPGRYCAMCFALWMGRLDVAARIAVTDDDVALQITRRATPARPAQAETIKPVSRHGLHIAAVRGHLIGDDGYRKD